MANWSHLDGQMERFRIQLKTEVGLNSASCRNPISRVAEDVGGLPEEKQKQLREDTPVPLKARLEELRSFNTWTEFARQYESAPSVVRASVVVQSYMCFVYLHDSWFRALADAAPSGSVLSACANYLITGKVHDFRNAFAHGNWRYEPTFTGLACWVLIDARNDHRGYREFNVTQDEMDFW